MTSEGKRCPACGTDCNPVIGPDEQRFRLDQLVSVKEAAQTLAAQIARVRCGEGPLVLTRRSKPVALLAALHPDEKEDEADDPGSQAYDAARWEQRVADEKEDSQ